MKDKIINLFLRISAMLVRLLFLLYLSKETTEYILGEYSLIATTISIAIILLGFDLYINGTREVIANEKLKHPQILFNQMIANIPIYLLFLPVLLIAFINKTISWDYIILFYILAISEHIGSELYRLFIAIEKPILANFLFLFRNASWGFFLIILHFFLSIELSIHNILLSWFIASFLSLIYALIRLFNIYSFKNISVDFLMVKAAYRVAIKFFMGTIAYKVVEFADRFFLDHYLGKDMVGIYSLFGQFGGVLNTVIYTVVITLSYPILFKSIYTKNLSLYRDTRKRMLTEILFISIFVFIGALIFLKPVLGIIGKTSFLEYKQLFYLFLLANTIFNISYVYHFILTGYKKDLFLMVVTIIGGGIDLLLNFILIPVQGVWGAIYSKIIAFSFILVAKYIYSTKITIKYKYNERS